MRLVKLNGRVKTVCRLWLIIILLGSSSTALGKGKIDKIHAEIIKKTPVYTNKSLSDYVKKVGEKVLKQSKIKGQYQFFVLDSPTINAFTPGSGYIYVNRGLLVLLTSEAQLAGVLAHEIGHNAGRHIGRRKSRKVLGDVAATAAAVVTGSGSLGSAINLANQARLSGFGREMELEADEYAAEYMYNANYAPEEMLQVLSTLKDHERFSTLRNRAKGGGGTYHGVFATHPRSDKRLREVIKKAGTLPPGEQYRGRESMRAALDGVVVGENYSGNKKEGWERFTHRGLGITFTYPEDWSRFNKGRTIVLQNADKSLQLKLSVEKTQDKTLTSKQALEKKYPSGLSDIELIDEKATKDLGVVAKHQQHRVALVGVGRNTFHFLALAKSGQLTDEQDALLLEIINSFRRATRQDLPADTVKTIYYQRLKPGQTFEQLAQKQQLGKYTEDYLRLMNGYYPKGEAEPGTWIKLVRSDPAEQAEKSSQ